MDIIVDIIMDIFTNRLHKDVIGPGLRENLYKPEVMMEMFESQAEKIKTVYTKYLGDHMKVKAILKNVSMRIYLGLPHCEDSLGVLQDLGKACEP